MATPVPAVAGDASLISLGAVDGVLVLTLDAKAGFEALRQALRDTFSQTPDRFRGSDARLDIGGRAIDLFDLRRLAHVLREEFGVTVTGLYCTDEQLHRYAERELKLKVWTRSPAPVPAPRLPEQPPAQPARPDPMAGDAERLLTVRHGLRSGQIVRFPGDIVLYGDLNPGAELVAGGNILVFGAVKGMAHAGARGDDGAIILCFGFRPTQLRIGRKIAIPPEPPAASGGRSWSPEIAWVRGGQIVIEPYQGRLPR